MPGRASMSLESRICRSDYLRFDDPAEDLMKRFILMHKTDARWERGDKPSTELIMRVGKMLGELGPALHGGEGLRASSLGARVRFSGGKRTITRGPFTGENELPSGFDIVRAESLEDAIEWA